MTVLLTEWLTDWLTDCLTVIVSNGWNFLDSRQLAWQLQLSLKSATVLEVCSCIESLQLSWQSEMSEYAMVCGLSNLVYPLFTS